MSLEKQNLISRMKHSPSAHELQLWTRDLDRWIANGGDINDRGVLSRSRDAHIDHTTLLYHALGCPAYTDALIKRGADVGRMFMIALSYKNYNTLPMLLETKMTLEEKNFIEEHCKRNLSGKQLADTLTSLEKAEIIEDGLTKVAMEVVRYSTNEDINLCANLYALSEKVSRGEDSDFLLAPYISKEEQERFDKIQLTVVDRLMVSTDTIFKNTKGVYTETDDERLAILGKAFTEGQDADFTLSLVKRVRSTMAKCVGIKDEEISYRININPGFSERSSSWHRDGGERSYMRAVMTIKGVGTQFAHRSEDIDTPPYYGSKTDSVSQYRQAPAGAIALFNRGPNGVVHAAPLTTQPRIVAVFDCDSCLANLTSHNITTQEVLQSIETSISPEIKAYNEGRKHTLTVASLLVTTGVLIRKLMGKLTTSKEDKESYTDLENKLYSLSELFTTRGYQTLAERTSKISDSLKDFNTQSTQLSKAELKEKAQEIFSDYQKLERVAKVIAEKGMSKSSAIGR